MGETDFIELIQVSHQTNKNGDSNYPKEGVTIYYPKCPVFNQNKS
jgi:hypothetical protein